MALVLVVGYLTYRHYSTVATPTRYILATATKQTIVTSISGTGQVSQDHTINITPGSAGKLTAVSVKQGDKVRAGQVIAVVDETSALQAINQARASLVSAQANYDQILAGATSQDIKLAQLSAQSAQAAVDQANQNLETVTKQQAQNVALALTTMLNAGLQAVPAPSNIGNGTIAVTGTYTGKEQGAYTITAYNTGAGMQFGVSGLETAGSAINKNSASQLGTMGLSIQFSGSVYNNDSWTINIPNTAGSSYNSSYVAYQNALTAQSSALTNAQNQITNTKNNLAQSQINLEIKQQPPTNQQLENAKASLTSAQSQLTNAQLAYDNNILKAPFDGLVAALNSQVGDQVSASTNVATVINNQSIAAISLNEVDVAKIQLKQHATMTFDAIDGLSITGKVAQIDNIGIVSQGVVNYNVKVTFDVEDPRVKPGMSVAVAIITATAVDALSVPSSAIKTQNGRTYVQLLDPAQTQATVGITGVIAKTPPKEATVQIGISDGTNTQILSGLNEGDSVITQTISATKTSAAASSSVSIPGLGGGGFGGGGARTGGGGGRPGG